MTSSFDLADLERAAEAGDRQALDVLYDGLTERGDTERLRRVLIAFYKLQKRVVLLDRLIQKNLNDPPVEQLVENRTYLGSRHIWREGQLPAEASGEQFLGQMAEALYAIDREQIPFVDGIEVFYWARTPRIIEEYTVTPSALPSRELMVKRYNPIIRLRHDTRIKQGWTTNAEYMELNENGNPRYLSTWVQNFTVSWVNPRWTVNISFAKSHFKRRHKPERIPGGYTLQASEGLKSWIAKRDEPPT